MRRVLTDAFVRWLVPFAMLSMAGWISWTVEERVRVVAEAAVGNEIAERIEPRLKRQNDVIEANAEAMRAVAITNDRLTETLSSLRVELAELRGFVRAKHPEGR